jgi:hypothetical protein
VVQEQTTLTVADIFTYPRLCDLAVKFAESTLTQQENQAIITPFSLLPKTLDRHYMLSLLAKECGIQPSQIEDVFPCTPLQEGLISLTAKRVGDGTVGDSYVVRSVVQLQHTVDMARFQEAWNAIVSQEPILRTRIVDLGRHHGLVQVVVVHDKVSWVSEPTMETRIPNSTSMGLGTPLSNFSLVSSDTEKSFVSTMHHAVCDGWSWPLLLEKAESVYQGKSAALLEASPPFQGFVKHIQGISDTAPKLWRQQLEGTEARPFPQLPSPSYQPRAEAYAVHDITGLCWPVSSSNATASTLIRAAWSILSAQYTGVDDVVFGATVSGRQAAVPGVEHMTGPTIATVPIRIAMKGQRTIGEMLHDVQQQAVAMTAIEQMGLQSIRRLSDDAQRACQFGTLLVIQPPPAKRESCIFVQGPDGSLGGLDNWDLAAFNEYALLIECRMTEPDAHQEAAVQLRVSFDSHVLDVAQVERICQQVDHVLKQLCMPSNHSKQLAELDLVCGQDLRDIWTWNRAVPPAVEACVHELVSKTAEIRRDAPAVCAWDGDLTYTELETLSTNLGHYLACLGIGRMLCSWKKWPAIADLICNHRSRIHCSHLF